VELSVEGREQWELFKLMGGWEWRGGEFRIIKKERQLNLATATTPDTQSVTPNSCKARENQPGTALMSSLGLCCPLVATVLKAAQPYLCPHVHAHSSGYSSSSSCEVREGHLPNGGGK
jgi:hypothetical protein